MIGDDNGDADICMMMKMMMMMTLRHLVENNNKSGERSLMRTPHVHDHGI